jgi:hypothetical protein
VVFYPILDDLELPTYSQWEQYNECVVLYELREGGSDELVDAVDAVNKCPTDSHECKTLLVGLGCQEEKSDHDSAWKL